MNTSAILAPARAPRLLLALCAALIVLAAPAAPARAAGVVGDGAAASCTEAALRAAASGGGNVSFNCGPQPVTITLAATLAFDNQTVSIDGGGKVTLSGGGATRVILGNQSRVTLRNLTIRDGRAAKGGGLHLTYYSEGTVENVRFLNNTGTAGVDEEGGGAIAARISRLTVRDSYFEGNTGINGGGIHSLLTHLTVERSTFVGNDSTAGGPVGNGFGAGGAIYTDGASYPKGNPTGGQVVIRDSVFRGNRAAVQGGAVMTYVYPPQDSVLLEGNLFEGNAVLRAPGGTAAAGGALRHGGGPLVLRNSLFVGNSTESTGGAVWSGLDFPGRIENVTFVDNRAKSPDGKGQGGALFLADGDFTIVNSTFANNYADFYAGAIGAVTERVAIFNSILAGNWAGDGSRVWNQCSRALAGGGNTIQTPSRSPHPDGDYPCAAGVRFADPRLGALGEHGGRFKTVPLLEGSPAIDAGRDCPATDSRGAARVGACDLGAFEFGGSPPGFTPPETPALQSVEVRGPTVLASWGPVAAATRYEIEVRAERAQVAQIRAVLTGQSRHAMVLGRGSFELRLRACNSAGCSGYSEARSATVTSDPARVFLPLGRR
jgi:hypothetical protein